MFIGQWDRALIYFPLIQIEWKIDLWLSVTNLRLQSFIMKTDDFFFKDSRYSPIRGIDYFCLICERFFSIYNHLFGAYGLETRRDLHRALDIVTPRWGMRTLCHLA